MNAIKFLLQEHEEFRRILKEINDKSLKEEKKKTLFNALCQDLVRHETMEQKIWYPNFKKNDKLATIIKHLITEEKTAAKVIQEFKRIKTQDKWEEKFSQFKKNVELHASEEEKKLFPIIERIVDETELEILGKKMRNFKIEFSLCTL